jgi:putative oxidoreductase
LEPLSVNSQLRLPDPVINVATLLGRIALSLLFIWSGFGKASSAAATIANFAKLGLPMPTAAFVIAVFVELVVGLAFLFGLFTRTSALILAFWCIASALVAHTHFGDRNMLIHFMKNVAMFGGLVYAALLGPGAFSIDALRARALPART